MGRLKELKPLFWFHVILNVLVVIFITGASYYHTPLRGIKDTIIYLLHLGALQLSLAGFLYFLSLNKWIFRIVFSFLFLAYCSFSFWAYTQDVSVTSSLIQAVFETTTDIAWDVITLPYLFFFLCALAALIFIMKSLNRINPTKGFLVCVAPAILCGSIFFIVENVRPGSFKNRLPFNVIKGIVEYNKKPSLVLNHHISPVQSEADSVKIVFVLGETVRADHIGLNGYDRNTTPKLSMRQNLISFSKLYTNNTYTATSIPQILTDEKLNDKPRPLTSVYSVANKGETETYWIGNQTLEKSFSPIVETNEHVVLVDKFKSEFSFGKKRDEAILPLMDSILQLDSKQLITLHMMGSHWWYENRYGDEHRVFKPVIDSKYLPSNTSEELINSYDNTIVYLDHFLDDVIKSLKREAVPSALVYVSDHGEFLGEGGKWLHAQDGEPLENPAYFIWFSEAYTKKFPEKVSKYKSLINDSITTNTIYPTLLDLLGLTIVKDLSD